MSIIDSASSGLSTNSYALLLSAGKLSAKTQSNAKKLSLQVGSQSILINKIEKHIDDVKKSNFIASKDVAGLLGQLSSNSSSILAQTNPELLNKYSGYLSAFRYDRAARFVSAVDYGLSTMSEIKV